MSGDHDCADAVARLYEYLDGELDSGSIEVVEAHLVHCSPCLEAFDFESELKRVVASKCSERIPEDLKLRLLELLGGAGQLSP
jgi:mycothiol system anti-sigma-R factor